MKRRLQAEGLSLRDASRLVRQHSGIISEIMLQEVRLASILSLHAKMMFTHPGRGTDSGEYRLYCELVCYVLEGGLVKTAIIPTEQQIMTIEQIGKDKIDYGLMPVMISDFLSQRPSELPVAESIPEPPSSGVRLTNLKEAEPGEVPRSRLPFPRWLLKPGATISIIVADDSGDCRARANQLKSWFRREFNRFPVEILVQEGSDLEGFLQPLVIGKRKVTRRTVTEAPNFTNMLNGSLPAVAVRWWKKNFAGIHHVPNNRRLVLLVTPAMASAIVALCSGDLAESVKSQELVPQAGQILNLRAQFGGRKPRLVME
ncbi:MAG: hypothetical protein ABIB04_02040 [Patescibacteria group bacterium]